MDITIAADYFGLGLVLWVGVYGLNRIWLHFKGILS